MIFRDLHYLVALEELRHFRKAAEKCFVSQPTLSAQIKKLEEELNISLVERSSRKVIFTRAGLKVVSKAKTILAEQRSLKEIAKGHQNPMNGTLHIGLIPTVAPYLLPLIMSPIKGKLPELDLFLYENQTDILLKKLEEGEVDCVILALQPKMENFASYSLYEEPLELALSDKDGWANNKEIESTKLKGEHLLTLEDVHCLRDQAIGFCFAAGALEDNTFKATSLETLPHMLSADIGLTLLPQLAIPTSRKQQGLKYIPFSKPAPIREIVLLYRNQSSRKQCFEILSALVKQQVSNKLALY